MSNSPRRISLFLLASCALLHAADPLAEGFATPPRESRPETWFHLIGGNVAKPGLSADLEAVKGAGLEGIQLFHGSASGEPWKDAVSKIDCLSPSWDDMIGHAANECQRIGLKFSMQNCPGWAMSGGPWIKPENAMRHLVWSRLDVNGGDGSLKTITKPQPSNEPWRDYRDVAVIAFPTPAGDDNSYLTPTAVRSNRTKLPWADVLANKPSASVKIAPAGEPAWVEVDFEKPVTLRSFDLPPVEKLAMRRCFDPAATIRVQAMGPNGLTEIARCTIPRSNWQDDQLLTLALPDTSASTYRFTFENKTPLDLTILRFSTAARVNDWQGQAGYVLRSLDRSPTPVQDPAAWVNSDHIVDLSQHMNPDGELDWKAPAGKWTVLRFGHVNTGQKNGPAPPEATGFECDKLSTIGADAHFAGYIGRISAPGGPADSGRLKGMVIDSWECHTQTWTPAMEKEFVSLRGYDLRKWLPALAGWVVDDHLTSERFLRDWRATLNDLLVANYYSRLAKHGRDRGMTLSFESGPGDVPTGDILQYYGKADIPMCEFWWPNDPHWGGLECKPMLPAVSAAHVYGKPRIAAESFTNIGLRWNEHPFMLKHLADRHFAMGLNHLLFHTYTHNPSLDLVPGTSFGRGIGTPFLRGQTWWKHMPLFTDYIARCSFMLEQGLPVADVLWYLGDDLDHKPRQDSPFPNGYKFDYLNSDALIRRITYADGHLKTPEGVRWKLLYLPNHPRLTSPTLARMRDLVKQGATVVGLPSFQNPTLSGGANEEARFKRLLAELWGDTPASSGDRSVGAGRVIWGDSLDAILAKLKIAPDVTGTSATTWCHRRTGGEDVYFVAAGRQSPLSANLSFRAKGTPLLWDPLTGGSKPVTAFHRQGDRTTLALDLPAAGSVFVIFRPGETSPAITRIDHDGKVLTDAADATRIETASPQSVQGLKPGDPVQPWIDAPPMAIESITGGKQLLAWENGTYQITRANQTVSKINVNKAASIAVEGPWTLSFPPGWDAPEKLDLPSLKPWSDLDDPAARAFSGTATYHCTVSLDAPPSGTRLMLDLGNVADIAELLVNDKPVATLWAPPFRADITSFVSPGENRISVKVTNTWFNRLTHDASLPGAARKTWTINGPRAKSPLQAAGLIGPVTLRRGQLVSMEN